MALTPATHTHSHCEKRYTKRENAWRHSFDGKMGEWKMCGKVCSFVIEKLECFHYVNVLLRDGRALPIPQYIISKVNRIDEDSFCCRYQYSEWNSFGCAFFVLSSTIIIPSWFPIESFNRIFYLPSVSIKGHLKVFMWEINSTEEARILNRAPCTLYLNICCRNCGEKLQNVRLHNHVQL